MALRGTTLEYNALLEGRIVPLSINVRLYLLKYGALLHRRVALQQERE